MVKFCQLSPQYPLQLPPGSQIQDPSRDHSLHVMVRSLHFFQSEIVIWPFFVFLFKPTSQLFCKMSFKLGLFDIPSCLNSRYALLAERHKREIHQIRRHLIIWSIISNINSEKCILATSVNQEIIQTQILMEAYPKMNQILKMCDIQRTSIYSHNPI